MTAYRFRTPNRPSGRPPNRYPVTRVVVGYLFLGHLTGCCLVLVAGMVQRGFVGAVSLGQTVVGFIVTVLLMVFYGWFFGTPPALLCGLIIAACRLRRTAAGLAAAAAVGAAVGWLFGALLSHHQGRPFFFSPMYWAFLSAATSALLGAFLLPPRNDPDSL